jgi:tetratricopeptide (TPR) repeat protein
MAPGQVREPFWEIFWGLLCGLLPSVLLALAPAAWCGTDNPPPLVLDSGWERPYHLQIILHVAPQRVFSPAFRAALEKELADLLRLQLGRLAHLEIRQTHPRLARVLAEGLGPALDDWQELSDVQTFFILIDSDGDRYRLSLRWHDGLTGQSAPVVRQEEVSEAGQLARRAAQLIDRELPLVGTVTGQEAGGVRLALRGGGLGVPLDRWLHPGEVLAVVRLLPAAGRCQAQRYDWALFQVLRGPEEGVCFCRYVYRYQDQALQPGACYRGLRLALTSAPLRLRLVEEQTRRPLAGVPVRISRSDFGVAAWEGTTDYRGWVTPPGTYPGLAFVQVLNGQQVRAQIPILLVDDRPVLCPVSLPEQALDEGRLELSRDRWRQRLYEELHLAQQRLTTLNSLLSRNPQEALHQARQGAARLARALDDLTAEAADLQQAARKHGLPLFDLREEENRLHELRHCRQQLEEFAQRLERVLQEAQGEKTRALRTLLEKARLLEKQADFEHALALYRQVIQEGPAFLDLKPVQAHLDELEQGWRLRNPAHRAARDFIYQEWGKEHSPAALRDLLPRAWKALQVCQQAGDRLSPQKLLLADLEHARRLQQHLTQLRQQPASPKLRKEIRLLADLAAELEQLHRTASAYVKEGTTGK